MTTPDISLLLTKHSFDLMFISTLYFSPAALHFYLKTHSGKQKRLYIYINIVFGWTLIFWAFSLYKAFYK